MSEIFPKKIKIQQIQKCFQKMVANTIPDENIMNLKVTLLQQTWLQIIPKSGNKV